MMQNRILGEKYPQKAQYNPIFYPIIYFPHKSNMLVYFLFFYKVVLKVRVNVKLIVFNDLNLIFWLFQLKNDRGFNVVVLDSANGMFMQILLNLI